MKLGFEFKTGEPVDWNHSEKGRKWRARWQREYRKLHPEKQRDYYIRQAAEPGYKVRASERGRTYRQRLRLDALIHYSGDPPRCCCCDERTLDFLTIDHINGGGRALHKQLGGWRFFVWLKKNNFSPGFQVLCMNCNFAKGVRGKCPHQHEAA